MRSLLLASLIALSACQLMPDSSEPAPPLPPDAPAAPAVVGDAPRPTTDVRAASFDQYCTRDDECVAVYEGNACDPCRSANAAIRRDALPAYRAQIGAYWSCYEPAACEADPGVVIGDPAICIAGRCTLPRL